MCQVFILFLVKQYFKFIITFKLLIYKIYLVPAVFFLNWEPRSTLVPTVNCIFWNYWSKSKLECQSISQMKLNQTHNLGLLLILSVCKHSL